MRKSVARRIEEIGAAGLPLRRRGALLKKQNGNWASLPKGLHDAGPGTLTYVKQPT